MTTCPAPVLAAVRQTFLAKIPQGVANELLGAGKLLDVPPGTLLPDNRSQPGLAIVVEGLVRAFLSKAGRQMTVRYARPGETLGLIQALGAKLDVRAEAVTHARLWTLSPRRLRVAATSSPALAVAIAEECALRVADAVEELTLVTFGSVRQRVARHLLDLAGAEDDGDLVACVTTRSLADATGSVREVVARTLKELAALALIERSARGILILDAARLDVVALGGRP